MTSTYVVTITLSGKEAGTERPIYTVNVMSGEHVCQTLSWFSIHKAREYAAEMSRNYLDAPILDTTTDGTHVTLSQPVDAFLSLLMPFGYKETTTYEGERMRTTFSTDSLDVEFLHSLDGKLIEASVYGYRQGTKYMGAMTAYVQEGKVYRADNEGAETLRRTKMGQAFFATVKEVVRLAS